MKFIHTAYVRALGVMAGHVLVRHRGRRRDRGDVPGWVLITVMTAGLVSALWLIPALR